MAKLEIAVGIVLACGMISGCHPSAPPADSSEPAAPAPTPTPEADGVHFTFSAKGGSTDFGPSGASQSPASISASADIDDNSARFSLSSSDKGTGAGGTVKAALNIINRGGGAVDGISVTGSSSTGSSSDGKVTFVSGGEQDQKTTLKDSVSSSSAHLVKVRSDYGGIKFVRSPSQDQISVEADVSFSGAQVEAAQRSKLLSGFKLEFENMNDALQVSVKAPVDFPKSVGFGVTYRIAIPQGLSIDARTENGAVEVEKTGRGGNITAASSYGSITVFNSGETIDARSSNGSVAIMSDGILGTVAAHSDYGAVSVVGPAKDVDASSSNGSVNVSGAINAAKVTARSDYGAVRVTDCAGIIEESSSNGEVAFAAVNTLVTRLTCKSDFGAVRVALGNCDELAGANLTTSNGSVSVSMPRSASVRVHAHTDNGSISKDGFDGAVSGDSFDKSFTGSLNGGKSSIEAKSDFGSVTVTAH